MYSLGQLVSDGFAEKVPMLGISDYFTAFYLCKNKFQMLYPSVEVFKSTAKSCIFF